MKKNITINLFGALYAIDEDAYELLHQYQENMHRYFSHKEGGEEIADDIEHRVAELLAELKAGGVEAISIEHIQDIIHRIGNPEEVSGEENDDAENDRTTKGYADNTSGSAYDDKSKNNLGKRLFRDPNDVIIGGVISGLAHYFGNTEAAWWRVGIVIITIMFTGFTIPAYLIMWICMPVARTPEDRLRMYGKPVNTPSINEEMMRNMEGRKAENHTPDNTGCLVRGAQFTMIGCGLLFLFPFLFLILILAIPISLLFTIFDDTSLLRSGPMLVLEDGFPSHLLPFTDFSYEFGIITIAALIVLGIPIYVLVRRAFFSKGKPYSRTVRNSLIAVWVTALAVLIGVSITSYFTIRKTETERLERETSANVERLNPASKRFIRRSNWEIKELAGVGYDIVEEETSLCTGERNTYFNFNGDHGHFTMTPININICRSIEANAGAYRLEALAFSDDFGGFFYVMQGDSMRIVGEVPVSFETGDNNLKDIPWSTVKASRLLSGVKDSITWDSISHSPRMQSFVQTQTFRHEGGKLTYGFKLDNSDTSISPWRGNRLAIIELEPVMLKAQGLYVDTVKLNIAYRELKEKPNTLARQKAFFEAFPSTWAEFAAIYQYAADNMPMYYLAYDQIKALGDKCNLIPDSTYCEKLVNIAVGGTYEADAPNYYKDLLHEKMRTKPNAMLHAVSQLREGHQMQFWQFYWSSSAESKTLEEEYNRLLKLHTKKYPETMQTMQTAFKYSYCKMNIDGGYK